MRFRSFLTAATMATLSMGATGCEIALLVSFANDDGIEPEEVVPCQVSFGPDFGTQPIALSEDVDVYTPEFIALPGPLLGAEQAYLFYVVTDEPADVDWGLSSSGSVDQASKPSGRCATYDHLAATLLDIRTGAAGWGTINLEDDGDVFATLDIQVARPETLTLRWDRDRAVVVATVEDDLGRSIYIQSGIVWQVGPLVPGNSTSGLVSPTLFPDGNFDEVWITATLGELSETLTLIANDNFEFQEKTEP